MGDSGRGKWTEARIGAVAAVMMLVAAAGASTHAGSKDRPGLRTPGRQASLSGMPFLGSKVVDGGATEPQMLLLYGSAMFGGAALCVAGAARRSRAE
jgi:hypothetical protein